MELQFHPDLVNLLVVVILPTIVFYEYLITLQTEISDIWRWKTFRICPGCLFVMCRYGGISRAVIQIIAAIYVPKLATTNVLNILQEILDLIIIINATAFTCLRVWAILGRRRRHLIWLIPLAFLPIGLSIFQVIGPKLVPHGTELDVAWGNLLKVLFVPTWAIALLLWDIVVLVSTLFQTFRIRREIGSQSSISVLLVRDGSWYFAIIGITQVVSWALSVPGQPIYSITLSLMTCRMILNLQRFSVLSSSSTNSISNRPSSPFTAAARGNDGMISTLRFGSGLGNVGAPFSFSIDEEDEDEGVVGEQEYLENPLRIGLELKGRGQKRKSRDEGSEGSGRSSFLSFSSYQITAM
ncbi:hypothetical protein C8Q75DRAFT_789960 [Abortiporus biennis]|nr:hypothetical protein C8Q75DRAFT_789960 [Abortiporus biennis]